MWINEYLYYYYYSEKAVEQILADGKTRGEEIMELNQRLLSELGDILIERNPQKALSVYHAYNQRREATYMHYARPDAPSMELADQATRTTDLQEMDFSSGEGYAGVALDIIQGLEGQVPVHIALNIPNQGAISCMQASDVVEVSSIVRSGHVNPIPIGQVPEHQELLMRSIKHYERLAVEAILARSKQKAAMALMAHPLVLSYSRACDLVRQYISAHQDHIGEWQ
jgi:6-phospho-beta-glucosidase